MLLNYEFFCPGFLFALSWVSTLFSMYVLVNLSILVELGLGGGVGPRKSTFFLLWSLVGLPPTFFFFLKVLSLVFFILVGATPLGLSVLAWFLLGWYALGLTLAEYYNTDGGGDSELRL